MTPPDSRRGRELHPRPRRGGLIALFVTWTVLGAPASLVMSVFLSLSSDGCAARPNAPICDGQLQVRLLWLPWFFWAISVATAVLGLRSRRATTGYWIVGSAIGSYVLANIVLVQLVT